MRGVILSYIEFFELRWRKYRHRLKTKYSGLVVLCEQICRDVGPLQTTAKLSCPYLDSYGNDYFFNVLVYTFVTNQAFRGIHLSIQGLA